MFKFVFGDVPGFLPATAGIEHIPFCTEFKSHFSHKVLLSAGIRP